MPPSGPPHSPAPAVGPPSPGAEAAARLAERLAQADDRAQAAGPNTTNLLSALCAEVGAGLKGVLAVTELLERQPDGPDNAAYIRTVADCGRTLLRLLNDAAELSRTQEGAVTLAPEPVDLRDLLDSVQTDWALRAAEDGVGLGAVFTGEAGVAAELDPVRLRQIYDLLIGHALKLTRRGGVEVSLQAERRENRVFLSGHVRDTGPGVDPAKLPAFFEPFGPAGRPAYGTGLDLALARGVVESMDGRIWAENNAGAGATVFFQIEGPSCRGGKDHASGTGEPDATPTLTGRVLIVDDNATNRTVARTLVELFGCTVETADDGVEAVRSVSHGRFDAVLMDINMPRMDGLAATRAIRDLPSPMSRVPIIALTANADPEDARTYRAAGMAGMVEKPIKTERLLVALREALAPVTSRPAQAAA